MKAKTFPISIESRKMQALQSVTFTSATKVIMAFKFPFWQRENGPVKKGGKLVTDLSVKQVYYPQKSKYNFIRLLECNRKENCCQMLLVMIAMRL